MDGFHKTIFLGEILEYLQVEAGNWYLDCTLGDGGHSLAILEEGGNIVGIDVDPEAIERAEKRFKSKGFTEESFKLVQGNFRDLDNLDLGGVSFAGIVFDLGVSTLQLKKPQKGFSFMEEGPLDMRMDPNLEVKALDLVNGLREDELKQLFLKYGEEFQAGKFAKAIIQERAKQKIDTTIELANLIEGVVGRRGKIHPATKIFQALRIAVNDELGALEEALPKALLRLLRDGLILVISFHSLEDRIIKNIFKDWESKNLGEVLTKKPAVPRDQEILENPRARSAKLRVFKKL